jgi:hypothetical protein
MMLNWIAIVSLVLCIANWLLFVFITFVKDLPELKTILNVLMTPPPAPGGIGVTVQQAGIDATKLAAATGTLAGAFKKAGPAPTAAALSVLFLLIALGAAAAGKF